MVEFEGGAFGKSLGLNEVMKKGLREWSSGLLRRKNIQANKLRGLPGHGMPATSFLTALL